MKQEDVAERLVRPKKCHMLLFKKLGQFEWMVDSIASGTITCQNQCTRTEVMTNSCIDHIACHLFICNSKPNIFFTNQQRSAFSWFY